MKLILPVIAAFLLLLPSFSLAETKEIVAEGTYNMGDGETPTVAESRALLQAKRTVMERSYSQWWWPISTHIRGEHK